MGMMKSLTEVFVLRVLEIVSKVPKGESSRLDPLGFVRVAQDSVVEPVFTIPPGVSSICLHGHH